MSLYLSSTASPQTFFSGTLTNKVAQQAFNEASKSLSPPPNKDATIMIDTKDMTATATSGFIKQGTMGAASHHGKPPKKGTNGNKAYVSSKIVDALINMKRHTEELNVKRTLQKERLNSMPKAKVIDET